MGVLLDGPSDTGIATSSFDWAQDDYNGRVRTAQIWIFFLTLRTRLALLDQKWTYPGAE